MSRFNHGNNRQRFDLYSFYALLTKCKIVELLDQQGNTPFDSDTIDQNVWNYAAYLYKDITDTGLLSYFDSDSFRSDSDGAGNTTWNTISKNAAVIEAYRPLRRFLYSLDSEEGINNTENTITSGFTRKYYTLPLSDSEGTIKHINVYSFLKTHFNRWFTYDPYERYKLASRVADLLDQDSDVRYRFGHNFLRACEEDSDLSRRLTELYSNVLQTDSEVRNEILYTSLTALTGLTPGGDSDAAVDLGHIITHVLNGNADSDSDIRNNFADLFIDALRKDSDTADSDLQNRLRDIISNTELTYLESPSVTTRKLLPMDSDDSGSIGDSDNKFSFINLSTLRTDNIKIEGLSKDRLVDIDDSEGRIGDTDSNLQWQGDSELIVTNIDVSKDSKFNTLRVSTLKKDGLVTISEDSELTNDSDLEFTLDSDKLVFSYQKRRVLPLDSEKFFDLLVSNAEYYTLDSEGVDSVIKDTPVKSEYSWFIGQRGDVYVIGEDPPDSEFFTPFSDSDLTEIFGPEGNITGSEGTVGYFGLTSDGFGNTGLTGVYAPSLNLTASTAPGGNSSNVFKEGNTIYPGGMVGEFEISYKIAGFGFTGFSMFPTSASAEASRTYLGTLGSRVNALSMTGYFYAQARLDNIQNSSSSAGSPYGGYRNQHFSGNITLSSYHGGSVGGDGGSIVVPGLTGGTFDSAYPTTVHQGRDSEGYWYIAVTGYDSTLGTMRRSPNYYFDGGSPTNATLRTHDELVALGRTAPHYARYGYTITDGLQLGYGNYDFYPVTQFRDITVTGLQKSNIIVNKNNTLLTRKLVFTSDKVVDTTQELSRARNDVVTKQEIFDTWYRFSHDYNSGGSTFTYPAEPSELNGWAYNAGSDIIYTTINSVAFSGFVSSDTYDDFTFNSVVRAHYPLASPTFNDDDAVVTIIGFVTEGIFGQPGYREHTLSVIRTAGGFPMTDQGFGNVTWGLVYNYSQDDVRLLVDGTNLGSASTNITIAGNAWVDFPNGTKVFIRRKGDQITCYCSTMNDPTHTLDSDTEITWDLASDSDTIKFRGPVRYGYGAHSQNGSYWSDIFFAPDEGSYLHYLGSNPEFNSSSGGNVYQYDPDTVSWVMDSDLTIDNTAGERILHNQVTHKTFYNDPISNNTIPIMTSRKFSDVMNLPTLTSEPDSDLLGPGGLRPGTWAIADGVSWDPVGYGAPAYIVFWDGEYWYYVDAQ